MEKDPKLNIENSSGVIAGTGDINTGGDFMVNSQKIVTLYNPEAVWQRRYLALTPYAEPRFFGNSRDAELEAVDEMLAREGCLALVNGTGGIGKTSIAAAWCARRGEQFRYILWVNCGEASVGEALLRCGLMEQLFPPGAFAPGITDDQLLDHLLSALCSPPARAGRNLLVLDNANKGGDLSRQRRRLEALAAQGWAILLTSRAEQTGLPEHKIGALPPPLARKLFLDYFQPDEKEAEQLLGRLLVAIGYNTLLIEALAKYLATRREKGKNARLEALCEQLERAGALRLPATDTVDVDWQNRHGHTPEALLEALFDLSGLDEAEAGLLLRLALLPSEPMQPPFLYPLFGVQPDSPEEAGFDDRLAGLARGGWLEWQAGEGYRVHPLTAAAVRKRLLNGYEACADLAEQFIAILEQSHLGVRVHYTEAARSLLGWLENEKSGRLALLTAYLADTLKELGDYRDMETLLQKAGDGFLAANDVNNAAVVISRLGEYFQNIGNFEQALEFFLKQTNLFEELFKANPKSESLKNGLAISYSKLGDIYQAQGNFEQALEFFLKRAQIGEELFKANPKSESLKNGLAISYEKLGSIYQAQGNFEQALEFFLKDLQLTEELFKANPKSAELFKGLGVSFFKLGQLFSQLGRREESRAYLEQALHIFNQLAELTRIPQFAEWAAYVGRLLEGDPDQQA
ncbi:MAG: ATP-binding protein [Saprospiraceae bacterium]|nr:ATP-binding protein [Saprospiraceae bacterium]